MADNRHQEAVDIVAQHVIAHGAENISRDGWDIYPEIGKDDWLTISERVKRLAAYPDVEQFKAAYDYLTHRAGGVEP